MKKIPKIPCKNCIVFAICNSKVQKLNGVYKTQFIIRNLDRCSLFSDWIYRKRNGKYSYSVTKQHIRYFAAFYNIKYDIEPDDHLAPTTYLRDSYGI